MPADGRRQAGPPAQLVDAAGFTVVCREDHGTCSLTGWQGGPDRADGADELRPSDGLGQFLVHLVGPADVGGGKHGQHERQGHRGADRGGQHEIAQPAPAGRQPPVDGHGTRGEQVDVRAGQIVDLRAGGDREEHEQQPVRPRQRPPRRAPGPPQEAQPGGPDPHQGQAAASGSAGMVAGPLAGLGSGD